MRPAIDLAVYQGVRSLCNVTDAGLAGLVHPFPSAATINLRACYFVTDGGVAAVAAGCPKLQHPDLHNCRVTSLTRGGCHRMP